MTKNSTYFIDHINNTIILSKNFHKAASVLNTPEYRALLQLRSENPTYAIQLREIKKHVGKNSYGKLTYEFMEKFIQDKEGKESPVLKEFRQVKDLSRVQAGPYAYVKNWFLKKYEDVFKPKATKGTAEETKDTGKETKDTGKETKDTAKDTGKDIKEAA